MAAGGAGLYIDYTSRLSTDRSDQIGTITFKKKTAERKYSDQMIWEDIARESPVFNYDTIRTADGSSAVVNLKDGTKIDLDQNTLVMLSLTAAGADIDLAGGSVFADAGEAAKGALNIRAGDTKVSVTGGALSLTKTAEKAFDINVASGSATVTGAAGPVSVGANQGLQISAGKAEVKKTAVALDSPAPNAYHLAIGSGSADIPFSWRGEGNGTLEISPDRAFGRNVIKRTGASGLTERIAKGDYYWRVTGSGGASEIRKFTVIDDAAVTPLSPSEGETLAFRSTASRVSFSWSASRYASSYRVEISKDALFTSLAATLTALSTNAAADNLAEGNYFWRVVPVYDFMNPRLNPTMVAFKVTSKSDLSVPEPVYPDEGARISIVTAAGGGVSFGWGRLPECDSYMIEIAKDKTFKEVIASESTPTNFLSKTLPAAEAEYYWRVTGHAPDGAVSRPSELRRFSVKKAQPPVQLSADQEGIGVFMFRWKDADALGRYRMEISKGKGFGAVFKSAESVVPSVQMTDLPEGEYSWRVSSLDLRGASAAVSDSARLSVSGFIEKPVPLYPVENVRLDIMRMKMLDFTWKAASDTTSLELEIHQYSFASDKLVYKAEITSMKYSINPFEVLSPGNFYWQISALKKAGGTVIARSAPSRGYFSIPAGPEIKAPKIGNMKIYVE